MARCGVCGRRTPLTASSLCLGVGCIREAPADAAARIAKVHARSRQFFRLPPGIPYSRLAFHPQLFLHDLPVTSRDHAERALAAARGAGLTRTHLGNRHLLGEPYEVEQ